MLDLNALKAAFAPLSKVGRDEAILDIGGVSITLRPLIPLEEIEMQRYAGSVLAEIQAQEGVSNNEQMTRAAFLEYYDKFKIEVVARAIVQINNLDLRDVESVPTGEVLENGTPVRMPRYMAMRQIVSGWSRSMLTIAFSRYGDLIQKISDAADIITKSSLPDLDAEIERVERRLVRLREDRDLRAAGDPSVTSKQITSLLQVGQAIEQQAEAAADAVSMEVPTPPARKSVVPPTAPPPGSPQKAPPVPAPAVPAPQQKAPPQYITPVIQFEESFGDAPSEPTVEERVAAARTAVRNPEPAGVHDGLEVFRLPTETISARGKSNLSQQKVRGNVNPNFKPRQ